MLADPKRSALLIMDFQNDIVEHFGTDQEALLERTARLRAAARRSGALVVYVVVGFREGYPEVSPQNKIFAGMKGSGRFQPGHRGSEIHARLAPEPGDVVVTKHRVSGFAGTDLDLILRSNGRDTLVMTGIATSGVVLSTLRHAADADYDCVVVRDACADRDEEVHRVLLDKVFVRQAAVTSVADVRNWPRKLGRTCHVTSG
jgi:nicotinamidase-related amidase